jgi:hypothetical protein
MTLIFAYDHAKITKDEESLQSIWNKLRTIAGNYNLKIPINETKIFTIQRKNAVKVKLQTRMKQLNR